jgi:tetratricopeptide (TPR) repeat protein
MTMKLIWSGVLAALVASPAYAQILDPKLAELQPAKWSFPLCPLKPAGKSLEKAVDLFKKSYDGKDKAALLGQAKDLIAQSIASEGQDKNAAAWYYLARVYLQQGDVGGVDSAFTKALALQPQCDIEINNFRQNSWANLANLGIQVSSNGGNVDTALMYFKHANMLYREQPHVAQNIGVIYANQLKNYDSAAVYFKEALDISEKRVSALDTVSAKPKDPKAGADTAAAREKADAIESRNQIAMSLGAIYQASGKNKEAIPILQRYLAWQPNDVDARKTLIAAYEGAGMADSAKALSNAMVSEMSKKNLDSLDANDLMNVGVAAFNAQKYPEAVQAFGKAAARNPYSRDAVYNLANAYLALNDWQNLVETATKLVAIEPMNEDIYRLLGQGHKGLKHDAEVLKAAEKLVGLPITLEMGQFGIGKSGAKLQGTATGRNPTDAQGKPIKPTPVTLVFEFVTSAGQVVDSKEVAIPVLQPGATHEITMEAKGADIAGWRYKTK